MKRKLLFAVPLLYFCLQVKAQVACPNPPPPGASSCETACVYCALDGYMGINNGPPVGGFPICNAIAINNYQWFGFVAGTTSIEINIDFGNCQTGAGLQVAVFDDCDADALACNPGFLGLPPLTVSYDNFVPGQTYYLMIDGSGGDVCNYEIQVLNGSTAPLPPAAPAQPQGPANVCPGAVAEYTIPPVANAGYYTWTAPGGASINGGGNNVTIAAPGGTTVTVTFGNSGGQLCVKAGNACFPAQQACINIVNQPVPVTQLPPVTVCYEDLPFVWEEAPNPTISAPGTYSLTSSPYDSYLGCDSTVKQTVRVLNQLETNLNNIYICAGACFQINGNSYCQSGGPFTEQYESSQGCDSVVQFSILTVPSAAVIAPAPALDCMNPALTLNSTGSATGPNVLYEWTGNTWNTLGTGPTQSVSGGGTYNLIVTNTLGNATCKDTATVTVASNILPPGASATGGNFNCLSGSVTLQGNSPTGGVAYEWSGPGITPANASLQNPNVDIQGTYVLVVTDPVNLCTSAATAIVGSDVALPSASAGGGVLTCATPNGIALNGGGAPGSVTFLWSGPGIGGNNATQQNPLVTQPGTYTLQITDPVNGCTATAQAVVSQDTTIPAADAGPDLLLNCSVASVAIDASASSSGAGISYIWTGPGITPANETQQSPANIALPGTYYLTVIDTNNACMNADTVVIALDTVAPVVSPGPDLILNCYNNAADTLNASVSGSAPGFVYLWSGPGITPGNENEVRPVVTIGGAYFLTVTNTINTCTAAATVTVGSDLTPPAADAGTDRTIDCVNTSAIIGGNSSSGANFAYHWTGPGITPANQALQQPTVALPGNYDLVVTDTNNGCTAAGAVSVSLNAVFPVADAGSDDMITCAQPAVILDGSGSSAGAGIQLLWTGPAITAVNQNQVSLSIDQPGTYILSITDTTNSCVTRDTVAVGLNQTAPVADVAAGFGLDCQTTGVVLDGSMSSSGPNFTYLWSGPGITAANANLTNPGVDQPGLYTLAVTDTLNGCTMSAQTVVSQDIALPTASAGSDLTLTCAQSTATIDGSASSTGAPFIFAWTGPGINTNNSSQQSPPVSASGTYTVTVTDAQNHCTATDEVLIVEDTAAPVASAGPDNTLTCAADTLQLDGSLSQSGSNILFAWTGPGIVSGQNTLVSPSVFLPGTYLLTLTDTGNGCTNTDAATIGQNTIPPAADAGSDQTISCANSGSGVTLSAAASNTGAGFNLVWSGPGITPASQSTVNPTVLVAGPYSVLVTNTNTGCTATATVNVLQDQNLPTANAGPDQTITCSQPQVILDGSGSASPGGPLLYAWSGPGVAAGLQNDVMTPVSASGIYTLTVENQVTGCVASDNVAVLSDNQPPQVTVTTDIITCDEPLGDLTVSSSLPGSTFLWEGPSLPGNQTTQAALQVGTPGLYSVTVTAPNGCTAVESTLMDVSNDFPAGSATGALLDCTNQGIGMISGSLNTPGATFVWNGPDGGFFSGSLTPTVTLPGTYTLVITSPAGCEREIEVDVLSDFTAPQVSAMATGQLDCNTTSLTINTSGTSTGSLYTYLWTTGDGHIVSGATALSPVVDAAGTYQLLVTNGINGCRDSSTVNIETGPDVPAGLLPVVQNIRCFDQTNGSIVVAGVVGGTAPFLYALDGGPFTGVHEFSGLAAGSYTIALEDANGCKLDSTVVVTEPGELQLELGADIEVQLGEEVTITAQVSNSTPLSLIAWNYAPGCDTAATAGDCLEFTYQPFQSYRHQLTLIDSNGCKVLDRINVLVRKKRLIYVPNIFNPESDDPFNALLAIQAGPGVARVRSWLIFDRWGDAVFEVRDYAPVPGGFSHAWDGTVRGDKGPPAVYAWYAEIEFIDGVVEIFKGDVTLKR